MQPTSKKCLIIQAAHIITIIKQVNTKIRWRIKLTLNVEIGSSLTLLFEVQIPVCV